MTVLQGEIVPSATPIDGVAEPQNEIQHRVNVASRLLRAVSLSSVLVAALIIKAGTENDKNMIGAEGLAAAAVLVAVRKGQQSANEIVAPIQDTPYAHRSMYGTTDLDMAKFGLSNVSFGPHAAAFGSLMIDSGLHGGNDNASGVMLVMGAGLVIISTLGNSGVVSEDLGKLRDAVGNSRNVCLRTEDPSI